MLRYVEPIEADLLAAHATGIDNQFMRLGLAYAAYLKGDSDVAYEHLGRGLDLGTIPLTNLARTFDTLNWNEEPRFAELRRHYETRIFVEKQKLLPVACGDDGFVAWRPSPETCAGIDAI